MPNLFWDGAKLYTPGHGLRPRLVGWVACAGGSGAVDPEWWVYVQARSGQSPQHRFFDEEQARRKLEQYLPEDYRIDRDGNAVKENK